MKYKIGIYGSAADVKESAIKKAMKLGKELGKFKDKIIVINGAAAGIPSAITQEAINMGVEAWGYSAAVSRTEHDQPITNGDDVSKYAKVFYIPKDFALHYDIQACRKYRNVTSTANCDAGIIISGRWGTMNEFTNLYDMGKVIGVLTGTGGIADELEKLMQKIVKKSKAKVFFESSPKRLLKKVMKSL